VEWTKANHDASYDEGWWLIGTADGKQRLSGTNIFLTKGALYSHIIERGLEGSPLHLKLLAYLYAKNKPEFLRVMEAKPANKTGALVKTVHAMARVAGDIQGDY
jgi:hypothetical protein